MLIIFILLLLNIASYLDFYFNERDVRSYFFRKTNFNLERNAPSVFSAILHFIAAALLAFIGASKLKVKKSKFFWWGMSAVILFIGLDELLVFHEKIGASLSQNINNTGLFYFAWVIPYGIALILLAILILKPLFELPVRDRLNFLAAGGIFVSGALGLEMFTGWYIDTMGYQNQNLLRLPESFVLSTFEELFEMIGTGFFVYALLDFIRKYRIKEVQIA
ncbi:hypothetical protein ACW6QP_08605 [Salegentibacter sp. HM20]